MPTFNVRMNAGDGLAVSSDPIEFPHGKAARDDAQKALAEIVRDRMPMDRDAHFGVEVEDEAGHRIYKASLDLSEHTDRAELENTTPDAASQPRSESRE